MNFRETSVKYDDGIAGYHIEFVSGSLKYEVGIDTTTGKIIDYDVESVFA